MQTYLCPLVRLDQKIGDHNCDLTRIELLSYDNRSECVPSATSDGRKRCLADIICIPIEQVDMHFFFFFTKLYSVSLEANKQEPTPEYD